MYNISFEMTCKLLIKMLMKLLKIHVHFQNEHKSMWFSSYTGFSLSRTYTISRLQYYNDNSNDNNNNNNNSMMIILHTCAHIEQQMTICSLLQDCEQFAKILKVYVQS